jgi:hypothetical protein
LCAPGRTREIAVWKGRAGMFPTGGTPADQKSLAIILTGQPRETRTGRDTRPQGMALRFRPGWKADTAHLQSLLKSKVVGNPEPQGNMEVPADRDGKAL